MKIKNLKFKIGLLVVLVIFVVFPKKALAASLSLGISPPIIQIDALPPVSIQTPITVQNLGEETVYLKPVLKPFKAKDTENGEVEYINDYPFILQRIQIVDDNNTVENLRLAPSQKKELKLIVDIPKDEIPGDYYFSIVFISNPQELGIDESNLSQAQGGISTNVLLSVEPKGKAKGSIEEFSAPFFLESGPVPFTVRVKNTGENSFAPSGKILIKNLFGQTIGKVDLLPVNILSNSIRAIPGDNRETKQNNTQNKAEILRSSVSEVQSSSVLTPKALWPESFLLGPYTATLTLSLSDQGPQFTKSTYFFAFPIQGFVGLFIALILILLIRARIQRKLE